MKKKSVAIILSICMFFISVAYAADVIKGNEIEFINTSTNLKATNVQEAIEELYNKATTNTSCKNNVAEPVLSDGLIPVKISDNGTVTYADTNKSWYNYCEKVWANAVILNDGVSYNVGDVIKESDIQSYFVWIPKYKYKLWNTGTASKRAHEIEIVFDTTDTVDSSTSCKTPLISGASGNCKNGYFMTHPAFISLGVNGFWAGKFETGYKGATNAASAQVNSSDSSKVIIKPNVYSWRNNTVSNMFTTAYNYKREMNSHMMKNTEWGAVAYLSHSKYGTNKEININNNKFFKTGYSALLSINQLTYPGESGDGSTFNQAYNTEIGYLASSTGNISGIYDMSGGAYEYMSSYVSGVLGSSGFTTSTISSYDSKYFDVYPSSSTITSYQNRILGDATGEIGPFQEYSDGDNVLRLHSSWYNDYAYFVESSNSWFHRGGLYNFGILASQFSFAKFTGGIHTYVSFRIVLSP